MQLAVGAATAALDAGRAFATSPRALATLATERSQGFIDAEPYNTRTWNGVWAPSERSCERARELLIELRRGVWEGGDGHFSFYSGYYSS